MLRVCVFLAFQCAGRLFWENALIALLLLQLKCRFKYFIVHPCVYLILYTLALNASGNTKA
jgi:hypothetical protein